MLVRLLLAALLGIATWAAPLNAYTEDFPPFNAPDAQGKPSGYAVELLALLMQEAQQDYQLELVPWARALSLAKHKPNSLVFTIARTPERDAFFYWIGPFASRTTALIRLRDSPLRVDSLADAKRYRIGVVNGDAGMEILLAQGFRPGSNLFVVDRRSDLIRLLRLDSIDFVVANPIILHPLARRADLGSDQFAIQLILKQQRDGYYFALNRQSEPALAQGLQAAFERLLARGALEPLKRKYQIE